MWFFYIAAGFLTAAFAVYLLPGIARRYRIYAAGVLPLLALAIYLPLGRPDLPSVRAAAADGIERRHLSLLAERPMTVLTKETPNRADALAVMGDISSRMGKKKEAKAFYARAVDAADKEDPRREKYIRLRDSVAE